MIPFTDFFPTLTSSTLVTLGEEHIAESSLHSKCPQISAPHAWFIVGEVFGLFCSVKLGGLEEEGSEGAFPGCPLLTPAGWGSPSFKRNSGLGEITGFFLGGVITSGLGGSWGIFDGL